LGVTTSNHVPVGLSTLGLCAFAITGKYPLQNNPSRTLY